jgi:hypothetical protein
MSKQVWDFCNAYVIVSGILEDALNYRKQTDVEDVDNTAQIIAESFWRIVLDPRRTSRQLYTSYVIENAK